MSTVIFTEVAEHFALIVTFLNLPKKCILKHYFSSAKIDDRKFRRELERRTQNPLDDLIFDFVQNMTSYMYHR